MHEKPRLTCTRDYDLFEMHSMNRDLSPRPVLEASMREHGFMPSSPIHCVRNGGGLLKVIRGHHRLDTAKRLGLPVWYVIDESNKNIFDLEGDTSSAWTLHDFLTARARAGDSACQKVLEVRQRYGLTEGVAVALLGGHTVASGKKALAVKSGAFTLANDSAHLRRVTDITEHCRVSGVSFATTASFVMAVSMMLLVPDFNPEVFKQRVSLYAANLNRRTSRDAYLDEIEALYNYMAKTRRTPYLADRARELSKERKRNFGRARA